MARCECAEFTGYLGCLSKPRWRVAVGSRSHDAQLSCGTHLNRTCLILIEAEQPRAAVTLTITEVKE